jgi:CheY-like chemotaxis protein
VKGRAMKKILIIEDHAEVREPLARLLKMEGYQTLAAGNGTDALKILASQPVDLLLLDLMMPRMDGLALMENLRRHSALRTIPILVLTGVIEGSSLARARELATAGVLFKSRFTVEELFARIREVLGELAANA